MALLAKRDYGEASLKSKLLAKGALLEEVEIALTLLKQKNFLNEERFVMSFIRMRVQRGQGPIRIRYDLKNLKIPTDLTELVLGTVEINWLEQVKKVYLQKYKTPPTNQSEIMRQTRFLHSRGFKFEHIKYALQQIEFLIEAHYEDIDNA